MTLNKTLNLLLLAAGLCLSGTTSAQEAAGALPAGTHPTAARVAEQPVELRAEGDIDKPFSEADLWQRIRRGFSMTELNSPMVMEHENWYANRPDYIQRFVDRGSKYLFHVVEEVERRGMPTEVALLPIIESAFNPQAYSRAKAAGMWQFIPSTGKNFGLKQDWLSDNRRDVLLSTHAALDYLQKLYGMFNSWELAFAAYNCGEGCVGRAIEKNARKGLPTDFLSLNLPPETRNYVPKLIAVKNIILSPGNYGIELVAVENRPYFAKVPAPARIDVKLAARLAEMPEDEFAALNPAFNRPVATSGTGYFLVPAEKSDTFRENMELYRSLDGPLVSWQTVTAKRGEQVDAVARRYGLTPSYLRATNGFMPEKKGRFTQAASLMVPMHKEAKIILATIEKKVALKAAQPAAPPVLMTEPAAAPAAVVVAQSVPVVASVVAARPDPTPVAAVAALAGRTHRVEKGETLFSIATRYGVTVEQLKSANALSGNALMAGQALQVASVGDAAVALPRPSTALVKVSAPARSSPVPVKTYVVRAGDTLFGIALKFGVELTDLLRWNKLSGKSVLQPGLRLRISS